MAVFGTNYSIIKSGVTEVDLRYSILRPTWHIPQQIKHQSIINGKVNYIKQANDKSKFEVIINLWKYADPEAAADEILAYKNTIVKFMPHQDFGVYIFEFGSSTEADFYITTMKPFYLSNEPPVFKDKILIILESLEPTQIPVATTVVDYLIDEAGDFLIDESGNKLTRD